MCAIFWLKSSKKGVRSGGWLLASHFLVRVLGFFITTHVALGFQDMRQHRVFSKILYNLRPRGQNWEGTKKVSDHLSGVRIPMGRFLRGFHQWGPDDLCHVAHLRFWVERFIYDLKKIVFCHVFFCLFRGMLGLLVVKSHVYACCLSGENLFQKNINVEKFAKTTPSPIFEKKKKKKFYF